MEVFSTVSIIFLIVAIIAAIVVLIDVIQHPQPMCVMNAVWPLTALWSGPVGFAAYFMFGRAKNNASMSSAANTPSSSGMKDMQSMPGMSMDEKSNADQAMKAGKDASKSMDMKTDMDMADSRPFWQRIALSTFHCGAGCTLADIVGESIGTALLVALMIHGIVAQWVLDYALALAIGAFFQFRAIRPMMKDASAGKVFLKALKVDCLSLTAWQVGMYTVSGILTLAVFPGISHATPAFWFIMQLAMFGGFICSYPMNIFLVKKGIKPAM